MRPTVNEDVDAILAEQTREEIIRAISTEVRTSQNQTDLFDETAAAKMGLNRTDHRCLDILERSGPISAGDLAAASGLTTGAITVVLDRLERSGYARRTRDSGDRRKVLVQLTDKAQRAALALYGPLAESYAALVESYSTDQLALILQFMRRGREQREQRLLDIGEPGPAGG
jgi:DNA-binding MarR family transcriptional regulator